MTHAKKTTLYSTLEAEGSGSPRASPSGLRLASTRSPWTGPQGLALEAPLASSKSPSKNPGKSPSTTCPSASLAKIIHEVLAQTLASILVKS